ncbi:MAG: Na/Pi cotransporter family protein [Bulleidia sp.]
MASISWDMILGGFALFMFGISFMGDGLKAVAGDKLRDYIDKYTSSTISAVLIGIVLTIIMQSSSASIAITIGLVRAGLMNLSQAAGIVMGANIGTTVTSFLIGLNIDRFALYIVFIGGMLICFFKNRKVNYWGKVIFGFGLMFYGLSAMGDGLAALKEMPFFEQFAISMANRPWMAMLVGVALTAVVQSSAATIGVVQKLYQASAITLGASLPFMFGANIGTTVTGILASLGGSLAARRTAALHTVFNIIGTLLGMLLLTPFTGLISSLSDAMNLNPMMQIAFANIIFKVITTLLFLPILKPYTGFIKKIIPGQEVEHMDIDIGDLDVNVANVLPSAAIAAATQTILKMSDVVRQDISMTKDFLNKPGTEDDAEVLSQNEALINKTDKIITDYLIRIQQNHDGMSDMDMEDVRLNLEVVKNLERIGDLAMNLTEFFTMVQNDKGLFTDQAMTEVNQMFDHLIDMMDDSIEIYVTKNMDLYLKLEEKESRMDKMEVDARRHHFKRMANNVCVSPIASSVYCDVLGTLERMADHACNIAKSAIFETQDDISPDELLPEGFTHHS